MDSFVNIDEAYKGDPKDLHIRSIKPNQKDLDRIANLKPNGAYAMAKAIKDPEKLVGRTKAYVAQFGNGLNPFTERMIEMGFTDEQVEETTDYHPKRSRIGKYKDFLDL